MILAVLERPFDRKQLKLACFPHSWPMIFTPLDLEGSALLDVMLTILIAVTMNVP